MKRQKNFIDELSQRDERSKRTEEGKIFFKTNVLVPKTAVIRKEEGATAAASHLPSLSWLSRTVVCQAGPAAFSWKSPNHRETPINYLKCPTFDAKRDFQTFILIGPPKQMKQIQRCR
jgi:hypothetical protein